jgi:hypothetical protein
MRPGGLLPTFSSLSVQSGHDTRVNRIGKRIEIVSPPDSGGDRRILRTAASRCRLWSSAAAGLGQHIICREAPLRGSQPRDGFASFGRSASSRNCSQSDRHRGWPPASAHPVVH